MKANKWMIHPAALVMLLSIACLTGCRSKEETETVVPETTQEAPQQVFGSASAEDLPRVLVETDCEVIVQTTAEEDRLRDVNKITIVRPATDSSASPSSGS